ncbi:MAG: hypothetical protein JXA33_23500 [Anaerolineae bacterium]|nr:hypothetical protein [Anaerolineae bacterium]
MTRLRRFGSIGVLFFLTLACTIPVPTVEPLTILEAPVEETQAVGLDGATRAEVRLSLLSRRLVVRLNDGVGLLQGWFHYNVAEWKPQIKQTTKDSLTQVTVNQGIGSQIPLGQDDTLVNEWEVWFERGVPIDLGVNVGSGTAQLDLTGLSISALSLTSGKSDLTVSFLIPNPEPLSTLRVTAGTGHFIASGLGNANFDHLIVTGGTGTVDLDFSGAWTRSALATIRAGAGKITLNVPATVGTRVKLSSTPAVLLESNGFVERVEDEYVNYAYGQATTTFTIDLTAGAGAVKLSSQ